MDEHLIGKYSLLLLMFLTILFMVDTCSTTFFSFPYSGEAYATDEVKELSGFIRSEGVDISPVELELTDKKCAINDSMGLSPCAWTSFYKTSGVIWVRKECSQSYYVIGHEMAHQVIYNKYPDFDGDHHTLLEFRQWEACLVASAKFHYNLCSVM